MATSSTRVSTMEQMLESLKKQEEKPVSDFLPPLPLRPLSKARLPSKCRMRIAASARGEAGFYWNSSFCVSGRTECTSRNDATFCALPKISGLEEFSRMTTLSGIISIQSAFRSHAKRSQFKKLRLVRSRMARKETLVLKERNQAANTIQKEIRRTIARKNYATTLEMVIGKSAKPNINLGKASEHSDSGQDKEYDERRSAVSELIKDFEQRKHVFNDNADILLEVKLGQTEAEVSPNQQFQKLNSRSKRLKKAFKDRLWETKTTVQKVGQNIQTKFLAIQIVDRIRNEMWGGLQLVISTLSNKLRIESCCGSSMFTEVL
ncbi:hypothetical protein SUGI_1009950 [Cryptomeria japonica]|nr:hypothetical protein SUGI_1009950 [Cryptomeria japonica]